MPWDSNLTKIQRYQKSNNLLIKRVPFYRLVREIMQHHLVCEQAPTFRVDNLAALQEVAEYYLTGLLDVAKPVCTYINMHTHIYMNTIIQVYLYMYISLCMDVYKYRWFMKPICVKNICLE